MAHTPARTFSDEICHRNGCENPAAFCPENRQDDHQLMQASEYRVYVNYRTPLCEECALVSAICSLKKTHEHIPDSQIRRMAEGLVRAATRRFHRRIKSGQAPPPPKAAG